MGAFHTLYYFTIFIAPAGAGHLSETAGTADRAFALGGGMIFLCLPLLGLFGMRAHRSARMVVAG
jgi:hypothetical protein